MQLFFILIVSLSFSFLAQAKRKAPEPVKPVTNAGIRYEVNHWSFDNPKMNQNGGYIRVVNARNGIPICTKQIYETKYDKNLESDVQDNFITSLRIEKGYLIINTESLSPIKKPLANFCD